MADGEQPAVPVVPAKTSAPTLEIGISTIVATAANQLTDHETTRAILTSAAPVIGLGAAFLVRLGGQLITRAIAINGAKTTYREILAEKNSIPANRRERIKQLEVQLDEARNTLKDLRADKIKIDIS